MSSGDTWKLSPLEFYVAWEAMGRDRMPFPLIFRTEVETQMEFDRERSGAAQSVVDKVGGDDGLYWALHALAQPQVRVEMLGYRRDGRERMVRVSAGIGDDRGVVAAQKPGPEAESGGDIVLFPHASSAVVKRITTILPDTALGSVTGIDFHRADLEPDERAWTASRGRTPQAEVTRFFERPYDTYVEIRVDAGPALDGWKEGGHTLRVIDFVDDGRYLIHTSERLVAIPVTRQGLVDSIQRYVDRAMPEADEEFW
ncbi:ESX secretion-associated protein EspG [Nocardia sp. CNY236]|uniref:ESX secretion-associated protein EspG n=1 Tax=Nocardia sp. CNY236 TaxID=1169152 RepID=UPI00048DECCF|nr:ESX secretion-associated protein EspG [Nocardia sp. CNY236]